MTAARAAIEEKQRLITLRKSKRGHGVKVPRASKWIDFKFKGALQLLMNRYG